MHQMWVSQGAGPRDREADQQLEEPGPLSPLYWLPELRVMTISGKRLI